MNDRQRTLLYVGAHPDDETFGVGGTLAEYAARGVKVFYACATRGEAGTVDPGYLQGFPSIAELRWHELECAAQILGLAGVLYLGYRDSGMLGTEDNRHPQALMAAPLPQVVAGIVKIIRELRPQVILTYDPIGGYGHPDHITLHDATVKAFAAAPDPGLFPEAGAPFQPQKLYYAVFPRGMLRIWVRLMPLIGKDPRHFGRNKDIDLAQLAQLDFPVNAAVRLSRRSVELRDRAFACHASQLEGGPPKTGILGLIARFLPKRELYTRAFPPVTDRRKENDLFAGT